MAAQSAHITSLNLGKPSLFDFIAQESLNELLSPAIRKVLESTCIKYPAATPLLLWYDEVFLISSSLLNYYYLKHFGGSFSETLYGLRRVGKDSKKLSAKEVALSLVALTVVPYALHKLHDKAEQLYFDQSTKTRKAELIIKANSTIRTCYEMAKWVQHLRFVSGHTEYNSPLLLLIQLRLHVDDPSQQQQSSRNWITLFIQRSFELGAFAMQCYQTWQSDGRRAFSSLQTVPPPPKGVQSKQFGAEQCPICGGRRHLDTALSVSGYVFCFVCIQHYVSRHHCCPITGLPASFNDFIRLYPDECS